MVGQDDVPADRQPEARPALPAGAGRLDPVEALEQVRQMLRRDAFARVHDLQDDIDRLPTAPGTVILAFRRRVAGGVLQQVCQDLEERVGAVEDGTSGDGDAG